MNGWISTGERLPAVGEWCSVFIDLTTGDWFSRLGVDPANYTSVTAAYLAYIDEEGYPAWRQWGQGNVSRFYLVTHWQPLPARLHDGKNRDSIGS